MPSKVNAMYPHPLNSTKQLEAYDVLVLQVSEFAVLLCSKNTLESEYLESESALINFGEFFVDSFRQISCPKVPYPRRSHIPAMQAFPDSPRSKGPWLL